MCKGMGFALMILFNFHRIFKNGGGGGGGSKPPLEPSLDANMLSCCKKLFQESRDCASRFTDHMFHDGYKLYNCAHILSKP